MAQFDLLVSLGVRPAPSNRTSCFKSFMYLHPLLRKIPSRERLELVRHIELRAFRRNDVVMNGGEVPAQDLLRGKRTAAHRCRARLS